MNCNAIEFDGTEQYYALDGQHRLAAFIIEQERDPERYKSDQVSMIVICHAKDKIGLTRARRLFTTVNRYAKKTSPATHTAMSEDNGVAIVTRRLIREHPFFKKRIKVMVVGKNGKPKIAAGNAMSAADKGYLMAIETFRKCNQHLLPADLANEFSRDQQIPSFDGLESAFTRISQLWDRMIDAVDPWKALLAPDATVEKLRTSQGGHILVRPIGITAFVGAVGSAPKTSVQHMRVVVSKFRDLDSPPWRGVLWNSATNRMAVTVAAEKLARRLWRYLLGLEEDKEVLDRGGLARVH